MRFEYGGELSDPRSHPAGPDMPGLPYCLHREAGCLVDIPGVGVHGRGQRGVQGQGASIAGPDAENRVLVVECFPGSAQVQQRSHRGAGQMRGGEVPRPSGAAAVHATQCPLGSPVGRPVSMQVTGQGVGVGFNMVSRVVAALTAADRQFDPDGADDFAKHLGEAMDTRRIVFSTPIMTNAGRHLSRPLAACAVPPVDLRGDLDRVKAVVDDYHRAGMGTGFNLDDLDDPVTVLWYLNQVAVSGAASGTEERPVGNMAILSLSHPRAWDFITCKTGADARGNSGSSTSPCRSPTRRCAPPPAQDANMTCSPPQRRQRQSAPTQGCCSPTG